MADTTNDSNKPSINITRGKKNSPRPNKPSQTTPNDSSGWFGLPTDLTSGARDVWLAGLGALSVVEDQGAKLFRALVQEGKSWEKTQRDEASKALKAAEEEGEQVAEATKEALDEQVVRRVREGVDSALSQAGIPTRSSIDALRAQVDDLAQKADRLAAQLDESDEAGGA
jgi:poly(hydroxyalkanoate) granule-associated protein